MIKHKILAIIPARGGSKGIPRKNIRQLAGKPLITWSIESSKQSKLLDMCVVSTEDEEIAAISQKYGAKVLPRPVELATDEASTMSVLQDILTKIDADVIVLLQPTSPIRDSELIDKCITKFLETDADSLATGFICKFYEYGTYQERRQELNGWFYDDGNVYVFRADLLRKGDRYGKKMERMVIDSEQNVEIDDEFEFWLAEQVMFKRIKEGTQ